MRRYLPSSGLTVRCRPEDYTRAMIIKRILTIGAAFAAGAAGTSLVQAQGYPPVPPGAVYTTVPQPYPPGGYPADYRRMPAGPDFDALEPPDPITGAWPALVGALRRDMKNPKMPSPNRQTRKNAMSLRHST